MNTYLGICSVEECFACVSRSGALNVIRTFLHLCQQQCNLLIAALLQRGTRRKVPKSFVTEFICFLASLYRNHTSLITIQESRTATLDSCQSETLLRIPRHRNQARPHRHSHSTENLHIQIPPVIHSDQRPSDRVPRQPRGRNDEETGAGPHADFLHLGDLDDKGGRHGDKGSGGEAVESGKGDDGGMGAGGDPEGQDEDHRECGGDDHDVEAADAIAEPAGDDAAEDAVNVG